MYFCRTCSARRGDNCQGSVDWRGFGDETLPGVPPLAGTAPLLGQGYFRIRKSGSGNPCCQWRGGLSRHGTGSCQEDSVYHFIPGESENRSGPKITLSFENFKINVPKVYSRKAERWFGREYFGGYSRPPLDNDEYAAVRRAVSGVCGEISKVFWRSRRRQ